MAISKIILNGVTQMDLTQDTVAAANLISPNTAHDAAGLPVTGTASGGSQSNDFIITLTYNSTSEMWEPDSTYAEIIAANTAGKTISTTTNDPTVKTSGIETDGSSVSYTVSEQTRLPIINKVVGDVITIYSLSSSNIVTITASFSLFNTSTATAESSDVLAGKTFFNSNGSQTGSIQTKTSSDLSASGAVVTAPAGFYSSNATYTLSSGTEGTPTATKGTVSNNSVTVTPSVTNVAGYISGGTHSGTAVTVTASELVSGSETKTVNGTYDVTNLEEIVVNVPTGTARTSSDLTVSGATVTVPAGLYSSQASASVASGTAGTPTASKGTVSNHSIAVTPSVTNTTGYITGGTKNGTAVTVSASELVSGTYTVDSSGTKDVTNYASASVPAGTAGTPSATKGTVSNHQVSVTPSVTNTTGWISGGTKTGTAVTVTAAELASGNKAITENGTGIDVVGYSTVSVAVPFSTIYSGSSDPSSSTGSDGDIYIKLA